MPYNIPQSYLNVNVPSTLESAISPALAEMLSAMKGRQARAELFEKLKLMASYKAPKEFAPHYPKEFAPFHLAEKLELEKARVKGRLGTGKDISTVPLLTNLNTQIFQLENELTKEQAKPLPVPSFWERRRKITPIPTENEQDTAYIKILKDRLAKKQTEKSKLSKGKLPVYEYYPEQGYYPEETPAEETGAETEWNDENDPDHLFH